MKQEREIELLIRAAFKEGVEVHRWRDWSQVAHSCSIRNGNTGDVINHLWNESKISAHLKLGSKAVEKNV